MKKKLLYTGILSVSGFLLACGPADNGDDAETDTAQEEHGEDTAEETS